jgi:hypothetical protein
MGAGGEVANALVCKTSIHGFKSHPVLQLSQQLRERFINVKRATVAENVASTALSVFPALL